MTFGKDLQGIGVTWRGAKRVPSDCQRDGGISLPDVLTRMEGPKSESASM